MTSKATSATRQAYWIPGIFVGAMLVIIAVNGVMVYFATSTFPGLDTDKAYVNGLAYNETLKEAAASDALGWRVKAVIESDGGIVLDLSASDGRPVTGLSLQGKLARTTTTALDRDITFVGDPSQPGRYRATVNGLAAGLWELRVAGAASDGTVWQATERVMAP